MNPEWVNHSPNNSNLSLYYLCLQRAGRCALITTASMVFRWFFVRAPYRTEKYTSEQLFLQVCIFNKISPATDSWVPESLVLLVNAYGKDPEHFGQSSHLSVEWFIPHIQHRNGIYRVSKMSLRRERKHWIIDDELRSQIQDELI